MGMYVNNLNWLVECDQCHSEATPVGVALNVTRQQARRNAIKRHYTLVRVPDGRYVTDRVYCADCVMHNEAKEEGLDSTIVEQMAEVFSGHKSPEQNVLAALRVLHLAFREAGNDAAENSIFNVMSQHDRMHGK